ncbi:UDP-glucosyltransferase 29-like [Salvia miltiorrhiza]|uniref:UDP-glucosyltransferase 29-like n=1 Tax=Salvia miltiorrhiza TaxID=226208 RepID=UPI0025ACACB5|nr:UDP-glucosyltransferase 29-like [Salvia miltiorrhiza]
MSTLRKNTKAKLPFNSTMAEEKTPKFTILLFPWLAYSHVHPFFELANNLAHKRFRIHFCSSAVNLDSIRGKFGKDSSTAVDLIELPFPPLPELPPHLHTTKNLPPNLMPTLVHAFQQTSSAFSEIMNRVSPDLLIYDFFQPWAAKQARRRGIPSVYFATAGAAPFSFFYHQFRHGENRDFPHEEIYLSDREKIDASAPIKLEIEDADEDAFSFGVFDLSCDIVLIKGFQGFDGKYIDYLSELCNKRVIPTGPLALDPNDQIDEESSEILQWLSKKERSSTVFVCFGSEHFISMDQIREISKGLALCKASFVWVVRLPPEAEAEGVCIEDALIGGFLERERERGLVVEGWAPQARILKHASIGGFASHCGWSSIMEGLWFGVPIVAMPIKYDQPINARVVAEAGVGVEVVRGEDGCFSGEEVAAAIDRVVGGESGEGIRRRVGDLSGRMRREGAAAAVEETAEELLLLCEKSKRSG